MICRDYWKSAEIICSNVLCVIFSAAGFFVRYTFGSRYGPICSARRKHADDLASAANDLASAAITTRSRNNPNSEES